MSDKDPIDRVAELLAEKYLEDSNFKDKVVDKVGWRIFNHEGFKSSKDDMMKSFKDRMKNDLEKLHIKMSAEFEVRAQEWFKTSLMGQMFGDWKDRLKREISNMHTSIIAAYAKQAAEKMIVEKFRHAKISLDFGELFGGSTNSEYDD